MKFVEMIAKKIMGMQQRQKKTTFDAIFLCIYLLLTVDLIISLTTRCYYLLFANDPNHTLLNYILYVGSLCIIHMWIYMAVKYYNGSQEVEEYFEFIPKQEEEQEEQEKDKTEYKIIDEKYESFKDIWENTKRWMTPFPTKNTESFFEFLVKLLYTVIWIGIIYLSAKFMSELGFYSFDKIRFEFDNGGLIRNVGALIGFVLMAIGLFLNYFSYFMCIMFTYFLREVANSAKRLKFNHIRPSNTMGFHKLVHASSRVAIAFFFDSMIYVLILALDFFVAGKISPEKQIYVGISIACIFIPCIVSFLVVFILPKVFLSRLLREWKWLAVKEVEETVGNKSMDKPDERDYNRDNTRNISLDIIYHDEVPLVKTEVIVAIVAVTVDIISIVLSTANLLR